jgi:hypothetical protein
MVLSNIAISQLNDLRNVLEQLTDEAFVQELPLLDHTSIGKHIRHTLEFHQCLFSETELLSYDDRERNTMLETQREAAITFTEQLNTRLRFVQLDRILMMSVRYGDETIPVTTSLKREMAFLIEHTVHHMAILRIALTAYFPEIRVDAGFGYADSTIRFMQKTKVAI